jgi:alpha-tubulin suppressor-like RCC1 family protein
MRSRPVGARSFVASALLISLLGCGDEAESPLAPESEPALATTAAALSFVSVSAGWDHSCGVTADPHAYCWGNNQVGQLGTSDKVRRLIPTLVSGGLAFGSVDGGNFNTCGVTTGNQAYCWGRNRPNGWKTAPTLVSQTLRFVQVSAGADHVCGITAAGKAYCRGANSSGQLGDGTTIERSVPTPVAGGHVFRQISTSDYHTCAVTQDNRAYCWGDNAFGEIGDGTAGGADVLLRLKPVAVKGGLYFRQISAGTVFTCGLTTDNRAYCWGSNLYGQLGDETLTDRTRPTAVHGGRLFSQLDAGNSHVCAVSMANNGFGWGRGTSAQPLGLGIHNPTVQFHVDLYFSDL